MKLPRWKKEQKEKKGRQLKAKVRFLMAFVGLATIIFVGFSFFKIYITSGLPKNGRTVIVFDSSPVLVFSYDQSGKAVFLNIPDNTYLEAIHGYGQYKIESLYLLGKLEKRSGELLAGSVREFLGAPVDGWVKGDLTKLLKASETNLNILDRLRVWWKIKTARVNFIQVINLQETGVFTKNVLPDKSEGLTVNQEKLDYQLAGIFKDHKISAEHLMIEVLNGSGKPEMANRAARLITNLGGTVISLGNSEKESGECQTRASPEVLKSFTGQRLKKIFNCREVSSRSPDSRADLQLIVGLDYWQKLNQK